MYVLEKSHYNFNKALNSPKEICNGNNSCVVCNCKISPTYSNVWIDDRIAMLNLTVPQKTKV